MPKKKWNNIDQVVPELNEIIIYNGNLNGQEGRHMGNGFVELSNDGIDQFDEWLPKNKGFVTMKILHVDGKTKIEAKGKVTSDGLFTTEYRHKGMSYGATIPIKSIKA
jgi:hypothetical protein